MANLPRQLRLLLHAFGFSLSCILLLSLSAASGANRVESTIVQGDIVLQSGPGFDKELAAGQTHTYKISVAAGQYLRVVVEQHGIVIIATLYDSLGKELLKADNPSGAHGPIYVSTISQSSEDYRLEVQSTEVWANTGRYRIAIEELRDAKQSDAPHVAAEKDYSEGRRLYASRKYNDALKKFEAALSYWRGEGNHHWIALTEYCLAVTYISLDDRPAAAQHFDKSLEVQVDEQLDWRLTATVFNDRGANLGRLGYEEKAFESLNKAFEIYQRHQDRRGQASVFNNIAFRYLAAGRYRDARETLQKAVPLRQAENDHWGEGIVLSNIASSWERVGESRTALEGYNKALQVWQSIDSQQRPSNAISTLAIGYNNVALAHDRLSEWQEALDSYEKALSLYGTPRPVVAARTLDNIGELYAVLGDSRRAMEYYEEARSLSEGKDPLAHANVLNHIGELYLSEHRFSEALTYFERTLTLRKDNPGKANALTNVGAVYTLQGNPRKALESYSEALKLIEGGDDKRGLASTLQKIGEAEALLNESPKALETLNRSLLLSRDIADERGEANTLYLIALAERQQGNLAQALDRIKESLKIIESLRTKVASQRLRSSFFASQQSQYELYIDLRMRLYQSDKSKEHLTATLEASERSRAQSLVDILTEARADIHRGISESLSRREREAQFKLNDKARIQMEVLNGKHSKEQTERVEREVEQAIAEYDAVKATIRASNPNYAQLTQAQSLSVSEIQQLLDDDTLLLEYFLGDERSYLWLVSRTSIIGVASLPKRSEIESAAVAFYNSLSRPDSQPNGRALSQMLLGSVADKLGTKRLVIVGDGVLQYLPFAALPVPSPVSGNSVPYLIEEHEIGYLPSASVLRVLRTEKGDRKSAPLSVVVLANPVFDAGDERLKITMRPSLSAKGGAQNKATTKMVDTNKLRSGLQLVPLPATEKEALSIRDAIQAPQKATIALGFEASRPTVIKLQTEGYNIVHFATHGDLNTEHPELSSIILSLFDSQGRPQEGFLRLHDIYNLKLPADLIVLSACSTGLGSIIRGEGLIGLTRGFMHAGSPRVVASLWRVEDLGTSELMRRFYQHMAREAMSPSLALRQAQIDMLRSRRWSSPYDWAGFVIQGDWRAIH